MIFFSLDNIKTLENAIKSEIFNCFKPSLLLNKLKTEGMLAYIPEFQALASCPQDPEYHPEGSVWTHTLQVIDNAMILSEKYKNDDMRKSLILSALLHDIAKPFTLEFKKNKLRAIKHDYVGANIAKNLLEKLQFNELIIKNVVSLIKNHLIPAQFYRDKNHIKKSSFLNIMSRVDVNMLLDLATADLSGRDIIYSTPPREIIWFKNEISKINS